MDFTTSELIEGGSFLLIWIIIVVVNIFIAKKIKSKLWVAIVSSILIPMAAIIYYPSMLLYFYFKKRPLI